MNLETFKGSLSLRIIGTFTFVDVNSIQRQFTNSNKGVREYNNRSSSVTLVSHKKGDRMTEVRKWLTLPNK